MMGYWEDFKFNIVLLKIKATRNMRQYSNHDLYGTFQVVAWFGTWSTIHMTSMKLLNQHITLMLTEVHIQCFPNHSSHVTQIRTLHTFSLSIFLSPLPCNSLIPLVVIDIPCCHIWDKWIV